MRQQNQSVSTDWLLQNRQQFLLGINVVSKLQLDHRPRGGMVFPISLCSNTRRWRTIADTDRVNAPAIMRNRIVRTYSPTQHDVLTCRGWGQIHYGGLKTATATIRNSTPVRTAGQKRVAEVGIYPSVVVATADKAASSCDDVCEGPAVNGDLQDPCIKGDVRIFLFEIEVVPEGQLCGGGRDGNARRVDSVIQNIVRIWREERVWQGICRRGGHSRIRGYPKGEASAIHSLSSGPSRRQCRRCYAIEVLSEANHLGVATSAARHRNIVQIVEVQYIASLELHGCRAGGRLKVVEGEGTESRNRIEVFKDHYVVKKHAKSVVWRGAGFHHLIEKAQIVESAGRSDKGLADRVKIGIKRTKECAKRVVGRRHWADAKVTSDRRRCGGPASESAGLKVAVNN